MHLFVVVFLFILFGLGDDKSTNSESSPLSLSGVWSRDIFISKRGNSNPTSKATEVLHRKKANGRKTEPAGKELSAVIEQRQKQHTKTVRMANTVPA